MGTKALLKALAQFTVVIAAVFAVQIVGAALIVAIVVPAGAWLEYFAARDMQEIAVIGVMVIVIGGFIGVIMGINHVALWWRMRRIRRLQL